MVFGGAQDCGTPSQDKFDWASSSLPVFLESLLKQSISDMLSPLDGFSPLLGVRGGGGDNYCIGLKLLFRRVFLNNWQTADFLRPSFVHFCVFMLKIFPYPQLCPTWDVALLE